MADVCHSTFASEIWKTIPGWEGLYEVSNVGRIRSIRRLPPLIRKPFITEYGYHQYTLKPDGGKKKMFYAHVAVALAFVGPKPGPGYEVRHLDDDKSNNTVGNLVWGTKRENTDDAMRNKRVPCAERHYKAIYSNEKILAVASLLRAGDDLVEISVAHEMTVRYIQHIMFGRKWSSLTGASRDAPLGGKRERCRPTREDKSDVDDPVPELNSVPETDTIQ